MTDAQTEARAIARCVRGCATDDQYIELVERIATALTTVIEERDRLREAVNQSRLAFTGYVSVRSAIDKIDALPTTTLTEPKP